MANVKNANDILIGTGKVYVNTLDVGQIDGDMNFTHGKEYFEKKSGFPAQVVKKVLIGESFKCSFNLLEANLETLQALMPEYVKVTETAGAGLGIGGGTTTDQTFLLEFWHKRTDGKYRCVRIWKCQIDGDFTMGFKEQADAPIPITVTALVDSTKPVGQQLGVVVDYEASEAPDGGW